jgi:chorismate mutase
MEIADWRRKIDEVDQKIVHLLNERAKAVQQIGALKEAAKLPVYEASRERTIFENVCKVNQGPLPDVELKHIYERIIDVMRALQRDELASNGAGGTDR